MKTLLASAFVLLLSNSAFAAADTAKGEKILSCSASDGDYVELAIYANPDGTVRASVTEESFGGSYPTFHYEVKKSVDAAGNEEFRGAKFFLKLKENRQAKLTIDGNSNEMDCR